MGRILDKIINNLSERDLNALKAIYNFRCLSYEQIFNRFYRYNQKTGKEVSDAYFKKILAKFNSEELIEKEEYKEGETFFLTTRGVNVVKEYFHFPANIYDENKKVHKKGYLTSSELKVSNRFITHQMHLNDFVLGISKILNKKEYKYKYEDEKHIKSFIGIRPDGILTTLNHSFFLEMDMGTENYKQLQEKWNHYRIFIDSNEFFFKERNIKVLFIVEGITDVERRIKLIKKTLKENLIDKIDKDIEFYVDTTENLINIIQNKILKISSNQFKRFEYFEMFMKKHNVKITNPRKINNLLNEQQYLYYGTNKKDYFVIDEYFGKPFSTLNKITYFLGDSAPFEKKYNKRLNLLIVVENEKEIFKDLKLLNIMTENKVFFTTLKRLKNSNNIYEALFVFNSQGDIFTFNNDLEERIHEKKRVR